MDEVSEASPTDCEFLGWLWLQSSLLYLRRQTYFINFSHQHIISHTPDIPGTLKLSVKICFIKKANKHPHYGHNAALQKHIRTGD